jgi:hypothetical protein
MFAKLWRLPLQLSSVIGDIVNGESLFRVDPPACQLWQQGIQSAKFRRWLLLQQYGHRPMEQYFDFPGDPEDYIEKHFVKASSC